MAVDASVRRRWIQAGVIIGVVLIAIALILPAIEHAREAARRSQSKNNLKQIGLALSNYHEEFKMLPHGGVFGKDGTPFHGWTAPLDPFLEQKAVFLDPRFPWDDPVNIDYIIHGLAWIFQNPSIPELHSPDGLPLVHYAANQRLFYRNSVVSLKDVKEKGSTALVGDCNGNFVPLGYPFNWRDLSLGIGISPVGFGCPTRDGTMFVMVDESVRWLNHRADATVALALAGPGLPEPSPDEVAKPAEPYRLMIRDYWRYLNLARAHKGLMTFRLAPDRRYLQVDFRHYDDPKVADPERWRSHFQEFSRTAPIEHVEVIGQLRAGELQPFLAIPTLRRLTVTRAEIADDQKAVLAGARKDIVVD